MSSPSLSVTNTSSKEFVEWMAAVWKANDLRNKLNAQLEVCAQKKPK